MTSTENGMAVDKKTIVELSNEIMDGATSIPRSKIRKLLNVFSNQIVDKITIPLKMNSVVDDIMVQMERLEQGILSKSDV